MNSTSNTTSEVFWSESVQNRIGFRVNRLVRKFSLSRHDREDLMQGFLLALINASRTYDPDKGPAGALITGTLNQRYKKLIRKLKLQQQRVFDDAMSYEDVDPEFQDTFIDPSLTHQLSVKQLQMDIELIMTRLNPKQQELCELLKHYSIAEAAEIRGQSRQNLYGVLGTIRKRFRRAGFEKFNF